MTETVEVDREYLWALEVLALDRINCIDNQKDVWEAEDIATNANLTQPIEL